MVCWCRNFQHMITQQNNSSKNSRGISMCKNKLGQRAHIQATVMVSRVPLNPSICTRHALTWPVKDAMKEKRSFVTNTALMKRKEGENKVATHRLSRKVERPCERLTARVGRLPHLNWTTLKLCDLDQEITMFFKDE